MDFMSILGRCLLLPFPVAMFVGCLFPGIDDRFTGMFIDRNSNPQKTKKAPQNGCFFNTPCAPYERK
ncbi:hypothetical protein QFS46_003762 [Escherichia coli]|nr:hypothetical protein [Escherichia coli]EKL8939811.1 hypothetical protein [Escherichia coli]EKY6238008.1 hypothetical protein [Escherichia coli]